ncbi:hypothetical protein IAD21_04235 [Abditibacteriota bacterium]|nr:hypothetical protein IAD21_04235 [Abditibacteriota bacterium]
MKIRANPPPKVIQLKDISAYMSVLCSGLW